MDFLGLSNLTVIRDTLTNIRNNGKEPIDYTKIPLDDKPTYELLARGDTLGVFQLDSDGMRSLLKTLKPDNFNDISALIALYRPGPMDMDSHNNYAKRKNGLQKITPIHPEVAEPLKDARAHDMGIARLHVRVELVKLAIVGQTVVGIVDGSALDRLRKTRDRALGVEVGIIALEGKEIADLLRHAILSSK